MNIKKDLITFVRIGNRRVESGTVKGGAIFPIIAKCNWPQTCCMKENVKCGNSNLNFQSSL